MLYGMPSPTASKSGWRCALSPIAATIAAEFEATGRFVTVRFHTFDDGKMVHGAAAGAFVGAGGCGVRAAVGAAVEVAVGEVVPVAAGVSVASATTAGWGSDRSRRPSPRSSEQPPDRSRSPTAREAWPPNWRSRPRQRRRQQRAWRP